MLKKLSLFILIGLGIFMPNSFAASNDEIIDSKCSKQIMEFVDISREDVVNYKKAFKAVRAEDWKELGSVSKDIQNDILMGHVLGEKYLSKTYKSKLEELRTWLEKYPDHPQARKIYSMATKMAKKGEKLPEYINLSGGLRYHSPYSWFSEDYESIRPQYGKYLRGKVSQFRKYLRSGQTKRAKAILEDAVFKKRIPNRNYDAMSATLAHSYLVDNEDKLALIWSEKASKRSKDATASWVGGLSAWRSGNYNKSAELFSRLGDLKEGDEWLISAGAYWAYRCYDKLGKPKNAEEWLKKASKYKRTFHGILANYKLGVSMDYNWSGASYYNDFSNDDYVKEIFASESMKRAIILLQAKNPALAEKDLRNNYLGMTDKQQEVALFITQQYRMHGLGISIANCLRKKDKDYDHIAYPAPEFSPDGGWKVDKAFVLALVRQESAFTSDAMSGAGAMGLMQLMPNTAAHITKDMSLRKNNEILKSAEYNLSLGQEYVTYLLNKPFIEGNLFYMITAYNAGPGNLVKWQKKAKYGDDPLLYIEVIPARETRIYIKRVMTNYWIYNMRFDQKNATLEAVAKGEWPRF